MKLQPISESEFNQMEGVRQIIFQDYSQQFALLELGEPFGRYALSWRNSDMKPIVKVSEEQNTVWIGIEQQLAAICLQSGRILVAMPLTINLVDILLLGEVTAVLTEEEVLLFNPGGAIRFSDDLPDQGIGMTVDGENLVIKMLEGESLTLNPMTGYFKQPVSV